MDYKKKIYIILVLLVVELSAIIIPWSLGKFSSEVSGKAISNIAFYVIDSKYQTEEIKLDKIIPSDDDYLYTFSVANYTEDKMLETDAEYHIVIRTTTNLNLEYKLYKNGIKEDVFIEKDLVSDEDGTYFNIMKTNSERFSFKEKEKNEYELYITFPKEYISYNYQDIIENVEIVIISSQIME